MTKYVYNYTLPLREEEEHDFNTNLRPGYSGAPGHDQGAPRSLEINNFVVPRDLHYSSVTDDRQHGRMMNMQPRSTESRRSSDNTAYILSSRSSPAISLSRPGPSLYRHESFLANNGIEFVTTQPSKSDRHYCQVADCIDAKGRQKSVGRKADLKRHVDSVHAKPRIDCEYKKCVRKGPDGFSRDDHYREHLRGFHNKNLPKENRRRN